MAYLLAQWLDQSGGVGKCPRQHSRKAPTMNLRCKDCGETASAHIRTMGSDPERVSGTKAGRRITNGRQVNPASPPYNEVAMQNPVAWMLKTGHGVMFAVGKPSSEIDLWTPLYVEPPAPRERSIVQTIDERLGAGWTGRLADALTKADGTHAAADSDHEAGASAAATREPTNAPSDEQIAKWTERAACYLPENQLDRLARYAYAAGFDSGERARDRIAAPRAPGEIVAPREPTDAMLEAAAVFRNDRDRHPGTFLSSGLWQTMYDAAPKHAAPSEIARDAARIPREPCPVCGGPTIERSVTRCTRCEAEFVGNQQHDANMARLRYGTPIDKLLAEYTGECCDFTDIAGSAGIALRYAERMPDSHVRCLLYVLANAIQVEPPAPREPPLTMSMFANRAAYEAAAPSEIERDAARLDWIDANVKITERVKGWTSERWRWSLALPAADNIRAAIDAAIEQERNA